MVKANDFKNIDSAFVLKNVYAGASHEPVIKVVDVDKVGRKYVTVRGCQFKQDERCEFGLISDFTGRTEYLCLSEEDAQKIIEKRNLQRWFSNINVFSYGKYTLDQLRKVKEILGD